MTKSENANFDLEERTLNFAKRIIRMCKALPNSTVNFKLIDQIIRSAGSIGANYREANDALSKKDFLMRIKISRKEAKETHFWLELIIEANPDFKEKIQNLFNESIELKKIFSAIITKCENNKNKL
ncbi:MAG: four helix bundle protein [Parcubacteria group bacterium]|jgi:four helix bundle protein